MFFGGIKIGKGYFGDNPRKVDEFKRVKGRRNPQKRFVSRTNQKKLEDFDSAK